MYSKIFSDVYFPENLFFCKFVTIILYTYIFFLNFFNYKLQARAEIFVNEEKELLKRPVEYFVESKYEVNKFHYLGLERVRVDGVPVKVTFLHNGDQIPEIHHFSHILSNFYDNYRSWNRRVFGIQPQIVKYFSRHAIIDSISICLREKKIVPRFLLTILLLLLFFFSSRETKSMFISKTFVKSDEKSYNPEGRENFSCIFVFVFFLYSFYILS